MYQLNPKPLLLRIEPAAYLRPGEVCAYNVLDVTNDLMFQLKSLPGEIPHWQVRRHGQEWERTTFPTADAVFEAIENGTI